MKKVILLALIAIGFASCEKFDMRHPFRRENKEKPCPAVTREAVPTAVSKTFKDKYPSASSEMWFNKDNTGYCASFLVNSKKTLAFFTNDGSFIKEAVDNNQQGNHQDTNNDKGCGCEIEDDN